MLSGYIDGELTPDQKADLERELASNAELKKELEELKRLKNITGSLEYADIPEHVWEQYWGDLYRRIELGFGWILVSIGAIILSGCGLFYLIKDFFMDPQPPILLKVGVAAGGVGTIVLLVSIIRQRIFEYKNSRYKGVTR